MIHAFKNSGYNIIIDENSGAVHVVDEAAFETACVLSKKAEDESSFHMDKDIPKDILVAVSKKCRDLSEEEIREAYSELFSLYEEKALFTEDTYKGAVDSFTHHPTVVKALCLHVAHDCNLNCRYCFAGQGEYHGARGLMDLDTGKKALDFVCENSGARKNIEIDFFGGEPLMNWEVVKELVRYGRSIEEKNNKHFRFTLTTNGVLITDEVIEFCNKEMDNVVLSLDGRPEVHDRMRPFRGGQKSFDTISPNIKKFADSREALGKEYYVRGTYTRFNLDFSKDVLFLADQGFRQISVEPVVCDPSLEYAIREEDIPVLCREYDILAEEMKSRIGKDNEFNFYHFMIDLEGGPCVYKRLSGCGAGSEYLAVTPDGSLYPCHQFAGETEFLLGNVRDGIDEKKQGLIEKFKSLNVYTKKECSRCFSRYYCSGGCAANAYHENHDITLPYETGCALQRKRVECAIMLKAAKCGF